MLITLTFNFVFLVVSIFNCCDIKRGFVGQYKPIFDLQIECNKPSNIVNNWKEYGIIVSLHQLFECEEQFNQPSLGHINKN